MLKLQLQLPSELQTDLDFIKSELKDLKKNFQPKEPTKYVTRSYLANEVLHCNISTIHNLTVRGILTKYGIGGKVLYRLDEVESALVKL